jgi:hypothetical protein
LLKIFESIYVEGKKVEGQGQSKLLSGVVVRVTE